jgi:glyoxylase-like metal-dependent hydrolase (beta-lactamase superfamily II)
VSHAPDRIGDDLWSLTMPLPGGARPQTSFAYVLRDTGSGMHVVDPGWDSDENWGRLVDGLSELGSSVDRVVGIVVTHLHGDHLGLAARLRAASGARLRMHAAERDALRAQADGEPSLERLAGRLDRWAVPSAIRAELLAIDLSPARAPAGLEVDDTLTDGDPLGIAGFDLTVMWTPGHTHGSICLRDDGRRLLMTGDHVLPTMHPGVGLGGPTASNPLEDYLHSLERVSVYPGHEGLPGHGHRFRDVAGRAREHAAHHRRRTREVAEALAADPEMTTWQLAGRLTWTDGWDGLRGRNLFSALSQTDMHRRYLAEHGEE